MRKNINEKNVIEKIIDKTIVVSSGICTTIVPCGFLIKKHKVNPFIKKSVNIVNGLSVLTSITAFSLASIGFLEFSEDEDEDVDGYDNGSSNLLNLLNPFSYLFLSNNASLMLQNNGEINFNKQLIDTVLYAGGMIVGNIIVNRFDKGSYDKNIKL